MGKQEKKGPCSGARSKKEGVGRERPLPVREKRRKKLKKKKKKKKGGTNQAQNQKRSGKDLDEPVGAEKTPGNPPLMPRWNRGKATDGRGFGRDGTTPSDGGGKKAWKKEKKWWPLEQRKKGQEEKKGETGLLGAGGGPCFKEGWPQRKDRSVHAWPKGSKNQQEKRAELAAYATKKGGGRSRDTKKSHWFDLCEPGA